MLKETVTSVPQLSTEHGDVCKGCVLGKYAKATFPRSEEDQKVCCSLYTQIFATLCPLDLSEDTSTLSPSTRRRWNSKSRWETRLNVL